MSAYTPGPWTVSDNAIYGSNGLIKPLVAYLDDRFADDEAANNARLIAAAPILLAALQAVADYWAGGDVPADIDAQIRAAIARATGVQP